MSSTIEEFVACVAVVAAPFGWLDLVGRDSLRTKLHDVLVVDSPARLQGWADAILTSMDRSFDFRAHQLRIGWRIWLPSWLRCLVLSYLFYLFLLFLWTRSIQGGVFLCSLQSSLPGSTLGLCFDNEPYQSILPIPYRYGGFLVELLLVWPIILNFLLDYLSLIVARSGVASVYQKGGALAFLKGPVVNLFQTTVLIAAVGVIAAFVSYAVGFAANFPPPYYALSLGENLALAGRVIWSGLFFWRSDASPTLSIGMVHVVSPYVATLWLWLMTIAASLTMGLVRILRVVSRSINVDRNHIIRVMMGVAVTVFSLAFWGVQMVESL